MFSVKDFIRGTLGVHSLMRSEVIHSRSLVWARMAFEHFFSMSGASMSDQVMRVCKAFPA